MAIAKYYSEMGIDATVYESASDRLDEIFDTKGRDLSLNLNTYGISYCKDEIEELRGASEVDVTSNRYRELLPVSNGEQECKEDQNKEY